MWGHIGGVALPGFGHPSRRLARNAARMTGA